MEKHELCEVEVRLVNKLCELFGEWIDGSLNSANYRALNDIERRIREFGEVGGTQVMQAFRREVVSRIAEVEPRAAQRIAQRLSGRSLFGDEPPFGEEGRG